MDVVTAFFRGEVEVNIYIEIPGCVDGVDRKASIYKLLKALYGSSKDLEDGSLNCTTSSKP